MRVLQLICLSSVSVDYTLAALRNPSSGLNVTRYIMLFDARRKIIARGFAPAQGALLSKSTKSVVSSEEILAFVFGERCERPSGRAM